MAGPLFFDRVQESSTITGTGTYTLTGANTNFQAWSVVGNGNTAYYMATDGTNWEVGLGTYTLSGTTLARTTILASSNANAAVSWSAGTKTISLVNPAAVTKFSANVEATGRFGLDNAGGFFAYQAYPSAPGDELGLALRGDVNLSYTGGTSGNVLSTINALTTVGAGVNEHVWGMLSVLNNYATTAGENVAIYGQGNRYANGETWAGVFEARDHVGTADPTTTLTGLEVDNIANGTDANKQRIGVLIVGGKNDPAGAANTITYGINISPFNNDATQATFTNGFYASGNYTDGINLKDAVVSHSALWLADSQKIFLDTAGTRSLKWNGTNLVYGTATNANAVVITDSGQIGINGAAPASVNFQITDASSGQMRMLTTGAGAVDFRMNVNDGAGGSAVLGTYSNHPFAVFINGAEVARFSSSGFLVKVGALGYETGAGGTVTQATSKSTGVTLSKACGSITMNAAALAASTIVSFVLTDTLIAATDVLVLNHISGGTPGSYSLNAQCAAGSATINVRNNTGGSLSEAIVIQFALVKGVVS